MADTNGDYKVGDAILLSYQAAGIGTGLTIKMDVYDEAHAKDTPKCVAAMTEIGTTGRYYATFIPDVVGDWIVLMYDGSDSSGQVIKEFSVSAHNIDAVGNAVDDMVLSLADATNGLAAIKTDVDSVNTTLGDATNGLAAIKTAIGAIGSGASPAMVG